MNINRVIASGQLSSYGPKISWTEQGTPQTAFMLVLEEGGYQTFVPCLRVRAKRRRSQGPSTPVIYS
jgi:hypothetical protein